MTPANDMDQDAADPCGFLNEYYRKNRCLPTTWRGRSLDALANEILGLPGLLPEVAELLKMHS
jgi:hypothetical protein